MLGYWGIRGVGEKIRHLLEYCSIPYEQEIYGCEDSDRWFCGDKERLSAKNPAISLPYLIDGDKVITESDAICVHICLKANRLDLLGRTIDEKVTLATVYGIFKDFYSFYLKLVYGHYN